MRFLRELHEDTMLWAAWCQLGSALREREWFADPEYCRYFSAELGVASMPDECTYIDEME